MVRAALEGLIRKLSFGESGLIKEGLIRSLAFGESGLIKEGLIRRLSFGESRIIKGLLYFDIFQDTTSKTLK